MEVKQQSLKQSLLTEIASAGRVPSSQSGNSNNGFADLFGQVTREEEPQRRDPMSSSTQRNETGTQENRRPVIVQREQSSTAVSVAGNTQAQTRPEESAPTAQNADMVTTRAAENDEALQSTCSAEEELAEVFDVPPEVISQILNELNLELYDLEEADNMQTFVQAVYEAETPVELLEVEGITETLVAAKEVLKQYTQEQQLYEVAEPEEAEAIQPEKTYPGQEVDAQQELQEVVTDYSLHQQYENAAKDQTTSTLRPLTETNIANEYTQAEVSPTTQGEAQYTEQQTAGENLMNQQSNTDTKTQDTADQNINMHHENIVKLAQQVSKAAATTSSNVNAQDVINQIIEKMKVEVRGNMTEMKLTLRPQQLGDLTLRVKTENGIITAHFVAESQRVKEIIESNFNMLREALQEQGIAVSEFSVSVDHNSQEQRWRDFLFNQEKSAQRIRQILSRHSAEDEAAAAAIMAEIPTGATVDFKA